MQTAFLDMPRREYMADDAGKVLVDAADASRIASNIVVNGPYTNLSEVGLIDWATLDAGQDELRAESYVRNSCGLLGLRNNYFAIVLYAQTTKTVPQMADKSIVSGVRGIAEVWRDPSTGRCFVRTFQLLNE